MVSKRSVKHPFNARSAYIPKNEERCFQIGYLFLQKLCTELKLDSICQKISKRHKFLFNFKVIIRTVVIKNLLASRMYKVRITV